MIDVHQIHEYKNAYMLFEASWHRSSILDGCSNETHTFRLGEDSAYAYPMLQEPFYLCYYLFI